MSGGEIAALLVFGPIACVWLSAMTRVCWSLIRHGSWWR